MARSCVADAAVQVTLAWIANHGPPSTTASAPGVQLSLAQVVAGGAIIVTTAASLLGMIASGVFFLYWLHRALSAARMLGARPRWSNSDAIVAFFIPLLSIVRPFEVLRDLHKVLPEDALPEPRAAALDHEHPSGYRDASLAPATRASSLSLSTIKAWWGCYLGGGVCGMIASANQTHNAGLVGFGFLLHTLALFFVIAMMRGINAQLGDRYRRVRAATPEALASAAIVLQPPAA